MRIVAFSDYHNNGVIDVPDGDVLVIAGDVCKFGAGVQGFNSLVSKLPHPHKLLVAGNHDNFARMPDVKEKVPAVDYLQDSSITIDGVKFYGSPWHNIIGMAFGTTQEEMKRRWDEIPDDTDVLITHMPPYGMLDGDQYVSAWGCKMLAERIFEISPRLCIYGHIHSAHGKKDMYGIRFFNVALTDGNYTIVNKPTIIDL